MTFRKRLIVESQGQKNYEGQSSKKNVSAKLNIQQSLSEEWIIVGVSGSHQTGKYNMANL